jgi:DNA invertase Pin-like site-specific DNA recombinase
MTFLDPPLRPRNGRVLYVLIIARISTAHQDRRSLAEQESLCKQYIGAHFKGPIKYHVIASQGSGEILDRKELHEAEALVETGTLDVVIVEDLARLCRRSQAINFCELCEDFDCRFIAINDNIDTAREDWRVTGLVTSFTHEQHNTKASRRLKDRLRERFKTGGAMACVIYGYVKPPHAKSDEEVKKDPKAQPIYDEWFRLLEGGASFSEVADWLNRKGVKPGPYSRAKRWDGRMVARVTFNPLLKGVRQRNNKITRRVNKTGRRRAFPAPPNMLLHRSCPHLAFIEPTRYDRVISKLRAKNAGYARGRGKEGDRRKGVAKKRTVWPGQHLKCGVCNRLFYWGGHGVKEHMMCSGCRDYRCWNAATFDGYDAGRRLSQAILAEISRLPDFDKTFIAKLKAHVEVRRSSRGSDLARVGEQLDDVLIQIDRVTDAITRAGELDPLLEKLRSLDSQRNELIARQADLRREPDEPVTLPTMDAIRHEAQKTIAKLTADTPEFGRLMHRLVPSLKVYPYRLCDGGGIVLRAKVTLDLTPLTQLPDECRAGEVLRRELTVDLFNLPQRVTYREQVVELRAKKKTEQQVAAALGITVTAAQNAAALDRLMKKRKLSDPYVPVTQPPDDCTKLRRHRHARYRFESLKDG